MALRDSATHGTTHFQGLCPIGNAPDVYSKLDFLILENLSPRPFPMRLALLGPGPSDCSSRGFAPGNISCLPSPLTLDYLCASTFLLTTLPQVWPIVVVGKQYCATPDLVHGRSIMTYAMWHETQLSNTNVLHKVYLYSVVHEYRGFLQHLFSTILSNPHSVFVAIFLIIFLSRAQCFVVISLCTWTLCLILALRSPKVFISLWTTAAVS